MFFYGVAGVAKKGDIEEAQENKVYCPHRQKVTGEVSRFGQVVGDRNKGKEA